MLDEWGNRFIGFGTMVGENSLRTQIRTTIAQLAMFDAVNAVLDGPYRPFASKPASPPGASPEAAAIRAAYIVARHDFAAIAPAIGTGDRQCVRAVDRGRYCGPGGDRGWSCGRRGMLWMRRNGTTTPMRAEPRDWRDPRISPDGTRIAFYLDDGRNIVLYTYEWARDFTTRLKFGPIDSNPVWSPDSRTLVFSSSPSATQLANLYWRPADASGEAHRLTESGDRQHATSWHPSGRYLAFEQQVSREDWDLMILPMENDATGSKAGTPERLVSKIAQRPAAAFSPDGRWIAYASNESGRSEVFVRAVPGPGTAWRVSSSGGWVPAWSRRRSELFYLSPDSHLMVVSYTVEGNTFRANPPQKWSEHPINGRPGPRPFDLHPDGERFVVSGDLAGRVDVDKVVLASNFFDEVRRRLSEVTR